MKGHAIGPQNLGHRESDRFVRENAPRPNNVDVDILMLWPGRKNEVRLREDGDESNSMGHKLVNDLAADGGTDLTYERVHERAERRRDVEGNSAVEGLNGHLLDSHTSMGSGPC